MIYGEEYYTTNNYINYKDREDRYFHLTEEIERLLTQLNIIKCDSRILDYGCAFGFLSKALLSLGYYNTDSYDVSEYAKTQANINKCNVINDATGKYDILFALDVLEHMSDIELDELFSKVDCDVMIARIPVADYYEQDFYLDISKSDSSHINCKDKYQWSTKLKQYGFNTILKLNLFSIYDSTGVFSFIALK